MLAINGWQVNGLQDVNNLDTLSFLVYEFVQIVNCDNQHWMCVSTVEFKVGINNVYNSMRTGDIPMKTKDGIASTMTTHFAHIYVIFPDVQQQKSGWGCGLCIIAYEYILYIQ